MLELVAAAAEAVATTTAHFGMTTGDDEESRRLVEQFGCRFLIYRDDLTVLMSSFAQASASVERLQPRAWEPEPTAGSATPFVNEEIAVGH